MSNWMEEEFGKYAELERQSTNEFLAYRRGRTDGKLSASQEIENFAARTGNEIFFQKDL